MKLILQIQHQKPLMGPFRRKFSGNFHPLPARNLVQIIQLDKFQGLTGADFHANGVFHIGAPVALKGEFSFRPGKDHSERAVKGAGPAGDAAFFPNDPGETIAEKEAKARAARSSAARARIFGAADRKS